MCVGLKNEEDDTKRYTDKEIFIYFGCVVVVICDPDPQCPFHSFIMSLATSQAKKNIAKEF